MILENLSNASLKKYDKFKRGFFKSLLNSMMAGFYIGIGMVLLIYINDHFDAPYSKLLAALIFPLSLTVVVFTGADLFTGNVMLHSISAMNKKISKIEALKLISLSYFGNFLGAIVLAILVYFSVAPSDSLLTKTIDIATMKSSYEIINLIFKGILCNILVCLAILLVNITKDEVTKIILIFLTIAPFILLGHEHSVANMTVFSLATMINNFSIALILKNLIFVTIGNLIGGYLLALIYYLIDK